jgi:hypothetical protein
MFQPDRSGFIPGGRWSRTSACAENHFSIFFTAIRAFDFLKNRVCPALWAGPFRPFSLTGMGEFVMRQSILVSSGIVESFSSGEDQERG